MCGILGFIGTATPRSRFERCLELLRHRGPDGDGIWEDRDHDVLLGHRRLAIIDLTLNAAQPMVDVLGRWIIVFNGEIYNFQELRAELESQGSTFRSTGDTEVLLEAYKVWGERFLARLNGMFALAIYDKGTVGKPPTLLLARDRTGKKPLYYVRNERSLRFASELKALDHHADLDLPSLNHYLALGYYPRELSFQKGVQKLLPGQAAIFEPLTGRWRDWTWWTLPTACAARDVDPEALTSKMASLLTDSVRLRLISDVPVGIFLSGGLDSSLVTAAAARSSSQPVKTFTIRVPSTGYDESPYARLVATHFRTEHTELVADAASLGVLDEMADFLDEPLADSSVIPMFLVSRLTRRQVTVALGGDGGDELFGGYSHVLRAVRASRLLGWVPSCVWQGLARKAEQLPIGIKGRNLILSYQEGPKQERAWGTAFFDVTARKAILTADAIAELGVGLDLPERWKSVVLSGEDDAVQAIGRLDFKDVLPDDFLVKIDRCSMMHALEVRAPFLDPRLIDFAFREVPSVWKCDGRQTRRIERRLAEQWLPAELNLERKQGFSVPLGQWLRQAGEDSIWDRLDGLPCQIDQLAVSELIKGHLSGRENGSRLFALMMLASCCRQQAKRASSLQST
jgi:asparagine synthase (glutamine-hydrolysing)